MWFESQQEIAHRRVHQGRKERIAVKWEYKIVYIRASPWTRLVHRFAPMYTGLPTDLNEDFDQWGSEGWELVGTEYIDPGLVAFFKRPLEG
jgi:hypothetical protein